MNHPSEDPMRETIEKGIETESVYALIVSDDEVIAESPGAIVERPDATAHSEIEAIRSACESLDSVELAGCWLYSTHEPCPMCTAACCWAGLAGVVYAATGEDMSEEWETIFASMSASDIVDASEHEPELIEEFLRAEAVEIHER